MSFQEWKERLKGMRMKGGWTPEPDPGLPSCPLCGAAAMKGKGFRTPTDIEHLCECAWREPEAYAGAVMRLWRRWHRERTFRESLPPRYRGYLEGAYLMPREVVREVEAWREGGRILYLHGPPGTGKTLLAVRIGLRFAQEGFRTLFLSEEAFHRRMREEAVDLERPRLVEEVDALILDDLGKARLTPVGAEGLFTLFEGANTGKLRLVLTSNYTPEESARRMGENAEAVLSRIDAVLLIRGKDRRRERVEVS